MKTVTAAIIFKDNLVLIARRGPEEKLAGVWEFPGGKVENGESLQECLERELLEELGIQTAASEILAESEYHYDHGSIQLVGIKATILDGDIQLTVHDQVEWAPVDRLLGYQLAPADIPIATKLMEWMA